MSDQPISTDEALAMDWALGALERDAMRSVEARMLSDPAFRALCEDWAERLAPLGDGIAPVAPPAVLWDRIEAALEAPAVVVPARAGWWQSLGLWRGLSFASSAVAAVAVALLLVPRPPQVVERLVTRDGVVMAATLAGEGKAPLVTAAVDTARSALVLAPVGTEKLDGRQPELWLIPADGRPRSLGLISLGGQQQVKVPATVLKLVAAGAVLAVSLEPRGGSPTGLPTGPVVATGKLVAV
ncbi:anti-sigma factor [Sandaracinobacteroides saxicola]|uniref:Anti-sigma factor n=1 Tax=Sandaracinobacteroides saxicola TaxID=2759707 RepID=A0A7G5IG37_9SPHN|nr:anti-sigma factor [Sandaracinobacteroides saxicola]QMW22329.1 anti-sigma factor [Sandaracinobacteroides saxicola]